jgi:hypothetical protein
LSYAAAAMVTRKGIGLSKISRLLPGVIDGPDLAV